MNDLISKSKVLKWLEIQIADCSRELKRELFAISAVLSALIQNHEELRETGEIDDLIVKKDKKNIIVCKAKNE